MKRTVNFTLLVLLALTACSRGQTPSPQAIKPWPTVAPVASYNIQVTLDTQAKTLTGHEGITYRNTSNVSIPEVVLHLYLNAFKDANSIFLSEAESQHRGFEWDPESPGWIEVTGIRLADGTSLTLEPLEDGTLARASLPTPIHPGETLTLELDFHALLPKVFARTGYAGDFFMVGQWFPKLGVWQPAGWNAYPFHVNSEFFADFGTYDVEITLPNGYITGGAGLPAVTRDNADGTQTVTYHAEAVIDFSWTASPHFLQAVRVVDGTEIIYLYLPEHKDTVIRALDAAESALVNFGDWYGPYPYPRLTVVDVPDAGGGAGGMEYPTLVTAGTVEVGSLGGFVGRFDRFLESVIIHEIGHQWWYAMAAFNEAEEPWLDEGFTEYSTARLMQKVYGSHDLFDAGNFKASDLDQRRFSYLANSGVPMVGKAWDFVGISNYEVGAYSKPTLALSTLEGVLGQEMMLKVMSTFFQRFQFQHPTTEDFRKTAEEVSGQKVDWFFEGLVYGREVVNYTVTAVDEHTVTVSRQGKLIIPTEILVTFDDRSKVLEPWDGVDPQKVLTYPDHTVAQAEVDPGHKIVVDLQWSDNGMRRIMDLWSWMALNVRVLYQIQNWMLAWGGL